MGMPRLEAQLRAGWSLNKRDIRARNTPFIEFNNVVLDFGRAVSHVLKPVFDEVNNALEPFEPVLELINAEVPVVSDIFY